jgi:hypothetical protein
MSIPQSLFLAVLCLAVLDKNAAAQAAKEADEVEATAKEFLKAFSEADTQKMKGYFADKVFVLGTPANRSAPKEKRVQSTWLSPEEFTKVYAKIFEEVGREKWAKLMSRAKPTLHKAAKDSDHFPISEAGDYVYNLNIREPVRGKKPILDEAVVFAFRKVGRNYQIVAHYADY